MIASVYGLTVGDNGLIDVHVLCRNSNFLDARELQWFALREAETQARHYELLIYIQGRRIHVIPQGSTTEKTDETQTHP